MDDGPQFLVPFSSLIHVLFSWIALLVQPAFDLLHEVCEKLLETGEADAFSCFQGFQEGSPLSITAPQA